MDLDVARIEEDLSRRGALLGRPLSIALETGSTNDDAREAAAAGAPHGACFMADAQRAGRGRGSHTWCSPPGENLYLSVVLRPQIAAPEVAPITLAIGLAVARTVAASLAEPSRVALKWPNDVYVGARKIAGILVEGQLRGDRVAALVAGVGLNIKTRHFAPEIAGRATSLALEGAGDLDRSRVAAALLEELGRAVAAYQEARLAPLLGEIRRLDFLRGREVEVGEARGVAEGIDEAGRLLLRGADGALQRLVSGEVTLTP